jgi:hypothetical protein
VNDGRKYHVEARRILAGESMQIPEKAHLEALDKQLQGMNQTITTMGVLFLALLQGHKKEDGTVGVQSMTVPRERIEQARLSGEMPTLVANPDGSLSVYRQRVQSDSTGPLAKTPRSVM